MQALAVQAEAWVEALAEETAVHEATVAEEDKDIHNYSLYILMKKGSLQFLQWAPFLFS